MPTTRRVSSKKSEDDVSTTTSSSPSSKKVVEQPVILRPGVNIVKRIQELEEIVKSLEIELQQIEKKRTDDTDQQGSSPKNADVDQLKKRRSEIQKEIKAHEAELKMLRWENAKSGILAVVIFALLYYVAYQLGYVPNPFEYSWGLTPEAVKKEAERAATAASTSPLPPLRQ